VPRSSGRVSSGIDKGRGPGCGGDIGCSGEVRRVPCCGGRVSSGIDDRR
jgi:hypothetical protein